MLNIDQILKDNEVDTRKYAAILIDKIKADGGCVVVSDKEGNVLTNVEINSKPVAANSRFYNQIMDDGVIFSPYIHRRWIAGQFLNMMACDLNVDKIIKSRYSYEYSIEYTKQEFHKLAYEMDDYSFEERKLFFSLDRIAGIFRDHIDNIIRFLRNHDWNFEGYQWVKEVRIYVSYSKFDGKFLPMQLIKDLEQIKLHLTLPSWCSSDRSAFRKVYEIIKEIPKFNLADSSFVSLSPIFIEAFKLSGVFYTFKQLVLFDHCVYFSSNDPEEIIKILSDKIKQKVEPYKVYGMLKDMMKANDYHC